jgi:LTXXQ motif family protein
MRTLLAAVAVALLGAASPVSAQSSADTLREAARELEDRRADAWLGSVATQLGLSAAQEPAFAAYAAALRAQAELEAAHRTTASFVDTATLPPAPDALAREVGSLRERADALARVQAAAAGLYGQLTAQQRIAFDFLALTPTGTGSD